MSTRQDARPAFYALAIGGWRDYVTLLHPPYTAWHLAYVVLGVALAPAVHVDRLLASLVAFFLAMGLSAHALDELQGRPIKTHISDAMLWAIAFFGLASAVALGIAGALTVTPWLFLFIIFGLFIAPAYNLEWFHGRFHSDFWFAFAWGSFPFLTAYWVSGERIELPALFGAVAVFALSLAQRTLSRRSREMRRYVREIQGKIVYTNGTSEEISRSWIVDPAEQALMLMAVSIVAASVAMLFVRM
jgi:hypothetical protein